jgi:hypothetical protein
MADKTHKMRKAGKDRKTGDQDELAEELAREAGETGLTEHFFSHDSPAEAMRRSALSARFPVIRGRGEHSDYATIRRRMVCAGKIGGSWRGGTGCLEMSLEDLVSRGCRKFGRNYVLAECGIGVHETACPKWNKPDGSPYTPKEMKANRKAASGIIGLNANGSMTSKALAASVCLKLGIRCVLTAGRCTIVDSWPDYDDCARRIDDAGCGMSIS